MQIVIKFNYKNVWYQKTIDENKIDKYHYEDIWDYIFESRENAIEPVEEDFVFEVNAKKLYYPKILITGLDMVIYVFTDNESMDPIDKITNIEVLYG